MLLRWGPMVLLVAAGCGRLGYAPVGDKVPVDDDRGSAIAPDSGLELSCATGLDLDEDDDSIPDGCDNCPGVFNPDQEDDGELVAGVAADGVGDACDPRPSGPGDELVWFDGFSGETLAPEWTVVGGSWSLENGELVQTEGGQDLRLEYTGDLLARDYVLRTRFTFIEFDPAGSSNAGAALRVVGSDGWICGVWQSSDGLLGAVKLWAMEGGAGGNPAEVPIAAPRTGHVYELTTTARDASLECSAADASVERIDSRFPEGRPALRTNRAAARFSSVALYAIGG